MKIPSSPASFRPLNFLIAALAVGLAGCGEKKQEPPPPTPVPQAEAAPTSATKNSFSAVTSKLDSGGDLYLYFNAARIMSGLSNKVTAFSNLMASLPDNSDRHQENVQRGMALVGRLIEDSGIEKLNGVGVSAIETEPGAIREKVISHHDKGEDSGLMWSVCGAAPHPLDGLGLLPSDTALAAFGDFDAPLLWNTVAKDLRDLHIAEVDSNLDALPTQFLARTGMKLDDVLASVGGEYGLILTLNDQTKIAIPIPGHPVQIPEPGLVIVAKVKDDAIFNRVAEVLKDNPMVVTNDEPGLKMRVMPLPLPIPISLRLSVARSGDYLFIASSDKLVRDILAAKAGTNAFRDGAEFKTVAQGMPATGNAFFLVSDRLSTVVMQAQQDIATNQSTANALQAMQNAWGSLGRLGGSAYAVASNGDEGWEVTARRVTHPAEPPAAVTKN